ncbi:SDR family oxidoreductase [Xenorhabdus sp. PB61.4]|uniref:SDR family NAD(P)-dependent oxidoreductase n=1 Tax=Xenorhabdus sp. PB61.4 TaxID=2788940 RepID=UPI001E2ECD98|nr:SDR family oxidoreductase [Xenorhabdus sp. PB61.4]MCC8368028.1 SDR family oxidoreductase [Xenorhabdus sp. PB61.4]
MDNFSEKTVLITGAGSGIGRSTAVAFAATGASLVLLGRRHNELERTAALISQTAKSVQTVAIDITDESAVRECFQALGTVHVAVNSAGIVVTGAVDEINSESFSRVLNTNVFGLWLCLKHEIKKMKQSGGGAIINIGSNVGAKLVRPGMGAYAASKAAVSSLTRTAALEVIQHGIRVNCICPGPVDTPLSYRAGEDRVSRDARISATNPSKRVATTEEIANAAVWLASDKASYIVGQDIFMDGGASI